MKETAKDETDLDEKETAKLTPMAFLRVKAAFKDQTTVLVELINNKKTGDLPNSKKIFKKLTDDQVKQMDTPPGVTFPGQSESMVLVVVFVFMIAHL